MPRFIFTDTKFDFYVGEKDSPDVDQLARDCRSAWQGNMDTFGGGEITRVTEEASGRIAGWFNNFKGVFVKR